jgi:hypothetical protein
LILDNERIVPQKRVFGLSLMLDSIKLFYAASIKEYQLFDLRKDPYEEKNIFFMTYNTKKR